MRSLRNIIKAENQNIEVKPYAFEEDFASARKEEEARRIPPEYMQTKDIYEDAVAQAEEITSKARQEAETIRQTAREEGYREGYDTGYEDGSQKAGQEYEARMNQELEAFQEEVRATIEELTDKKEELLEEYLDDLKKITMAIAEKIIHTSLSTSDEIIKRMILAATEKLKKTQWAKIYVAKGDKSFDVQTDERLLNELSHVSDHIKIIAMDSEEEGTCIVELPDVVIDASVNTQLENIKDILNNARI